MTRYHARVLRYLALSITLLVLAMAAFAFGLDTLGQLPRTAEVDLSFGVGHLPPRIVLGTWLVEAVGLSALLLLIQGRMATWWLDGLMAGWVAWVFRGPLLVLTATGAARLDPAPFWAMAWRWLLLYSLCGLLAAAVARGGKLERGR